MKKIINGRKYDTETAECVGYMKSGHNYSDFGYYSESIYKKRTGEFFLYGEGGPLSPYAKSVGRDRMGGEAIIPLTEEEAKRWCEENISVSEYEAIFGGVEE